MLRNWKLQLAPRIRASSAGSVYLQICHAIIEEINRGRLAPGAAMPGTRQLAADLEVNRKTVIAAYQELIAQKWLVVDGNRGTFVTSVIPEVPLVPAMAAHHFDPGSRAPQFDGLNEPAELPVFPADEDMIYGDDGLPDTRLFPVEVYARAYRRSLMQSVRNGHLTYGDPRGTPELREALSGMLNAERGLSTRPENICLARGSQMALFLAARILVRRGDAIVFEDMSYPPAREAFRAAGAQIVHVRLDSHGLDTDHLEELCRRHRVRAVYLTPNHQFPTTVLLKLGRRLRLLSLADQFGFTVIEDDYDHEFHFSHRPMLPIASMAPEKTLYIGSLSKLLAPGLRVGYMAVPAEVSARAGHEIRLIDRQGDPVTERTVANLIADGEVRRFARRSLAVYRERRDAFAARICKTLGQHIAFELPDGGLAFWLDFANLEDSERFEESNLREQLGIYPPSYFGHAGFTPKGFRLGYARLTEKEASTFLSKLAQVWS